MVNFVNTVCIRQSSNVFRTKSAGFCPNDTCASAALDKLARGKTQKFPIIFICGSPHTPRREAENLKGRKVFGFCFAVSVSKKSTISLSLLIALFSALTATPAVFRKHYKTAGVAPK